MSVSNDNNSGDSLIREDFARESVPNTLSLQESIVNSAKRLPQHQPLVGQSLQAESPNGLFSGFSALFRSTVIATIMIVAMVSVISIDFGGSVKPVEAFSESDLEWQELMLVEDDLLFAQL